MPEEQSQRLGDIDENMPPVRRVVAVVATVILGVLLVILSAVVATLGGFLNHCRGGYVHFGPGNDTKANHDVYEEWYWPQHTLGRLLFAVPTGLVVVVCAFHLKGSLVVMILTWFSLFAGWGSYMNIGMKDNYCSRAGAFDWLIGRQAYNWSINERFVREYSGMSLRGLIWTLPQGYVLEQMGFGWEYSLSGTVMPLVYFIGANTNTKHVNGQFIDGSLAVSELMWGLWVWFVLIQSCLSQGVRRARIWMYRRNPHLGFKPFSNIEKIKYESLNRTLLRAFYEGFVIIVTILYCFSLGYYSIVMQLDVRNKGQTFFGLCTATLFLVFSQAWLWGARHQNFLSKQHARKFRGRTSTANAIYSATSQLSSEERDSPEEVRPAHNVSSEMDQCEGLSRAVHSSPLAAPKPERKPLLSWPYSHPDRLSPTGEQRQQVLDMSEHVHLHGGSSQSYFMHVWTKLEKLVWMDVFVLTRRLIGVITLICTIFSIMITVTATIIGSRNARFMEYLDPPCKHQ